MPAKKPSTPAKPLSKLRCLNNQKSLISVMRFASVSWFSRICLEIAKLFPR
jgi:hypothetical protein